MRYEAPEASKSNERSRYSNPFFTLVLLLLVLVVGYKLISKRLYHTKVIHRQQAPLSQIIPQQPTTPTTQHPAEQVWIHYIARQGDTLAKIFNKQQLDPQDLHALMKIRGKVTVPSKLHQGQELDLLVFDNPDPDANYKILRSLRLKLNTRDTLIVKTTGKKFTAEIYQIPIDTVTKMATATITNTFLNAGHKAEIPDSILRQLMALFAWRVDFANDVRKGDYFTVTYKEEYLNGKKLKTDQIQSAEFVNKGVHYYAIRYTDRAGDMSYYNSTGASVQRAFLRRPVNSGYISSPFNLHRRHPILGYLRPHTGTDFAASYGTPIHATGDGRVMFVGRKGGYGRAVMLRHGSRIVTLYAHMSNYANKLKVGQYIKQGQVIGYVGTSGLSTGAHVHYEFRINGKAYDPMRVRLPNSSPIPKSQLASYLAYSDEEVAKLRNYRLRALGQTIPNTKATAPATPIAATSKP